MKKIRILIVDAFLSPGGGQEKVVLQLLKLLERNKFQIYFATGDLARIPGDIPGDVQILRAGFNSKFDLKTCFRIRRIVQQNQIDLINVHGLRAALLIRFAYLFGRKVRIVYTGQVNYEQLKQFSKNWSNQFSVVIGNFLDRAATDFIVFVSSTNLNRRLGSKPRISPSKTKVIYNGVNPGDLNIKRAVKTTSESKVIVTLSALVKRKGIDVLINAVKILTDHGIDSFEVRIGGEGPELQSLKTLITDNGLGGKVKMLGYVKKEDLLSVADIFVLPTYSEGLPLSIIEAGLFNLPVIATSVDGIPEIVKNNENGLLIKPGAPEELARAIDILLHDADLCRMLAMELNKDANTKFAESVMVSEYTEVFEHMTK